MDGLKPLSALGGLKQPAALKPFKEMAGMDDLETTYQNEDDQMASFASRVGEARAKIAMDIRKLRTGSTTLPELLVEAELRQTGYRYRAQLDLGWSRPDFVVWGVGPGAIIIRVQGDYWHSGSAAVQKDATQKERLMEHTAEGVPIMRVIDLWEKDVYAQPGIVSTKLAEGGV
jgi:hypothetical protein